jgi:hypothetical protein
MASTTILCGAGVGCLVTDQIEFEGEQNVAPMIIDVPGAAHAIGHPFWIDKSARTMVSLPVNVREANVSEPLQARWRLVSKDDPQPMFAEQAVTVTGEELRALRIDLETNRLQDGECARLELAVSGSFKPRHEPIYFKVTESEDDRDLDTVSWQIWEGPGLALTSTVERSRLAASCPSDETELTPLTPVLPMEAAQ